MMTEPAPRTSQSPRYRAVGLPLVKIIISHGFAVRIEVQQNRALQGGRVLAPARLSARYIGVFCNPPALSDQKFGCKRFGLLLEFPLHTIPG